MLLNKRNERDAASRLTRQTIPDIDGACAAIRKRLNHGGPAECGDLASVFAGPERVFELMAIFMQRVPQSVTSVSSVTAASSSAVSPGYESFSPFDGKNAMLMTEENVNANSEDVLSTSAGLPGVPDIQDVFSEMTVDDRAAPVAEQSSESDADDVDFHDALSAEPTPPEEVKEKVEEIEKRAQPNAIAPIGKDFRRSEIRAILTLLSDHQLRVICLQMKLMPTKKDDLLISGKIPRSSEDYTFPQPSTSFVANEWDDIVLREHCKFHGISLTRKKKQAMCDDLNAIHANPNFCVNRDMNDFYPRHFGYDQTLEMPILGAEKKDEKNEEIKEIEEEAVVIQPLVAESISLPAPQTLPANDPEPATPSQPSADNIDLSNPDFLDDWVPRTIQKPGFVDSTVEKYSPPKNGERRGGEDLERTRRSPAEATKKTRPLGRNIVLRAPRSYGSSGDAEENEKDEDGSAKCEFRLSDKTTMLFDSREPLPIGPTNFDSVSIFRSKIDKLCTADLINELRKFNFRPAPAEEMRKTLFDCYMKELNGELKPKEIRYRYLSKDFMHSGSCERCRFRKLHCDHDRECSNCKLGGYRCEFALPLNNFKPGRMELPPPLFYSAEFRNGVCLGSLSVANLTQEIADEDLASRQYVTNPRIGKNVRRVEDRHLFARVQSLASSLASSPATPRVRKVASRIPCVVEEVVLASGSAGAQEEDPVDDESDEDYEEYSEEEESEEHEEIKKEEEKVSDFDIDFKASQLDHGTGVFALEELHNPFSQTNMFLEHDSQNFMLLNTDGYSKAYSYEHPHHGIEWNPNEIHVDPETNDFFNFIE